MKVIKVGFSKGGMGRTDGCEATPNAVLVESEDLFLNESKREVKFSVDKINVDNSDYGGSFEKIEEFSENLSKENKSLIDTGKKPEKIVFLGGDHSITYPLVKGIRKNSKVGFVVFDSHPDCENFFKPPTHEDYLRTLVEDKIIDKNDALVIGLRNWDSNEVLFLDEKKIRYIMMKDISENGIFWVSDYILEFAKRYDFIYCSIDIDAIDPAYAPATGYVEPGGLSSREFLTIISAIKNKILYADIVEINPKKDFNNMTVKLGAKILWEIF